MDRVDLRLMLSALKINIIDDNIDQCKKFWFSKLQDSIIAFLNEDTVTAFGFFDDKNAERTSQINALIMKQKTNLDNVKFIMEKVKFQVDDNQTKVEEFLRMHEEVEKLKSRLMKKESGAPAEIEKEDEKATGKRGPRKGNKSKKK
jgi:hypothetical protein